MRPNLRFDGDADPSCVSRCDFCNQVVICERWVCVIGKFSSSLVRWIAEHLITCCPLLIAVGHNCNPVNAEVSQRIKFSRGGNRTVAVSSSMNVGMVDTALKISGRGSALRCSRCVSCVASREVRLTVLQTGSEE